MTASLATPFTRHVGIEVPIVGGAMYPCSNPELVAAVSAAGGIGVVQPLSMIHVHGHDLRAGLRLIRSWTSRPIGFNALIERRARAYERRMRAWVAVALEEGVRLFVTALGNPRWVCDAVHAAGGVVYHDVTERRWAEKALAGSADGLICVNDRAGGHAGTRSPEALFEELADLGVPLVLAGGVGDERGFVAALRIGYAAVQMGTRFIATTECRVHPDYHAAILGASADDIVLTDKLSGVPCAVIRTAELERAGLRAGPLARWLLRGRRSKRWMRAFYALRSLHRLKHASLRGTSYRDVFQAGKSAGAIDAVEPAGAIIARFARAATERAAARR